jgi:hypothetical protein
MSRSSRLEESAEPRQGNVARKLAVILFAVVLGGAVALAAELAGAHAQIASTAGAAITSLIAAAEELRDARRESASARIERLRRGDVYRHPLLVAFYALLALFLASNLVALPLVLSGYVVLYAVVPTDTIELYPSRHWDEPVGAAALITGIPLTFFYVLPIAKAAAHRIRTHAFPWVFAAVMGITLASALALVFWEEARAGMTTPEQVAVLGADFVFALAATIVGVWWAKRTQSEYAIRKLFKQLSKSDQIDLLDLVSTLPEDAVGARAETRVST